MNFGDFDNNRLQNFEKILWYPIFLDFGKFWISAKFSFAIFWWVSISAFQRHQNHQIRTKFGPPNPKFGSSQILRVLGCTGVDIQAVWADIIDVIMKTLFCVQPKIVNKQRELAISKTNCFELYGFDILLDSKLSPWLLEVNLSPSLLTDSPLDRKVKGNLVADIFNTVGISATERSALNASRVKTRLRQIGRHRCSTLDTGMSPYSTPVVSGAMDPNLRKDFMRIPPGKQVLRIFIQNFGDLSIFFSEIDVLVTRVNDLKFFVNLGLTKFSNFANLSILQNFFFLKFCHPKILLNTTIFLWVLGWIRRAPFQDRWRHVRGIWPRGGQQFCAIISEWGFCPALSRHNPR